MAKLVTARMKGETLSIRTSAGIKQLLRMAAEREHRSISSMMEVLILAYAQQHGIKADEKNVSGECASEDSAR